MPEPFDPHTLASLPPPAGLRPEGFVERPRCPLCGHDAFEPHIPFPDVPVRTCRGCGFIHPAVAMTPQATAAYYRDVFHSDWHRQGQALNSFLTARILARLIDLRACGPVLDVGCGYAHLGARLRTLHGIDYTGVEPSTVEAAYAREQLRVPVIDRPLDEAALPRGSDARFGVVMGFEMIEHAPDPVGLIALMADHVRPGGWLVLGTDNFRSAAVRRLGARFPKWIPHSHVSDFDPSTLRRAMESAPGLRVERACSYTPWETRARALAASLTGPAAPEACYRFSRERAREMNRTYRFWPLRMAMARAWLLTALRNDAEGSMMFLAARKG